MCTVMWDVRLIINNGEFVALSLKVNNVLEKRSK